VFVASLLYYMYAYLIPFGREVSGRVVVPALINVAMFTVFALHHSLLSRATAKLWLARVMPTWMERSTFTWIASIFFFLTCALWRPVAGLAWSLPGPARIVGYAVQMLGLLLTVQGSAAIDVLDLAGIRQVLDARSARSRRHVPLETRGVYAFVRHPLYFGWALFVFGAPDMTATRLVFAIVSTAYLVLAIPLEERSLIAVFQDEYRAYQARTRWRMFPGIW
jgi:protein-S-isoprenylcysteine O-methyltransferase Ste14